MKKSKAAALLAGALLLGYATHALAAEESTNMGVSGTVVASCDISATPMDFGSTIDVLGGNVDVTTTVAVTCTSGTAYDIGLSAGAGSGATVATRKMTRTAGGTETINYSLYSDSGRTTVWGATVSTDTVAGTGDGTAQNLTVYGRIPSGQTTVPPADYADTVQVTVTY